MVGIEKEGNAFRRELVRHQKHLMIVAMIRTHNKQDAQDLVQTTFMKALDAEQRFQMGTNMKAWLTTILVNQFIQERRSSSGRGKRLKEKWHPPHVVEPSQEMAVELSQIAKAISTLPEIHQKALIRTTVNGGTNSDMTHITSGTRKSRLSRARKSLNQIQNWER